VTGPGMDAHFYSEGAGTLAEVAVPPDDVAAIGRLVQGPFDGHVLGDLSHLLRPDPNRKGPAGYRRALRQQVSAEVLALITRWAAGILAA
jgi:uncharacterized protein